MYCGLKLDGKPSKRVRESANDIEWDNLPGGKEGFLSNPVHLHHDQETGLTLAPVHALCNAHSWHFYELPVRLQTFADKIKSLPPEKCKEIGARLREKSS